MKAVVDADERVAGRVIAGDLARAAEQRDVLAPLTVLRRMKIAAPARATSTSPIEYVRW